MLKNSSPIASGKGAPNTATELANTSRGLWPAARIASSSERPPSMLMRCPFEVLLGLARHDGGQMEHTSGLSAMSLCASPAAGRSPVTTFTGIFAPAGTAPSTTSCRVDCRSRGRRAPRPAPAAPPACARPSPPPIIRTFMLSPYALLLLQIVRTRALVC